MREFSNNMIFKFILIPFLTPVSSLLLADCGLNMSIRTNFIKADTTEHYMNVNNKASQQVMRHHLMHPQDLNLMRIRSQP